MVVLGAGATKACGGPLTAEILPRAFESQGPRLQQLEAFLMRQFGLPKNKRAPTDFPQLPLLLSLLDTAIDREHGFGGNWAVDTLRMVRKEAEYAVFTAIADALRRARGSASRGLHEELFQWIHKTTGVEPVVISLNYDLLADQALIAMEGGGFPDYVCQIETPGYSEAHRWGKLLKIHGSMNWIYCGTCDRLEIGIDRHGDTYKIALKLAAPVARNSQDLEQYYQSRRARCPRCHGAFRPVMITPTHLKDYRNPHIATLWYRAERELQECTRVIFIGYSLPWDDVDVIYLLKRGLLRADGKAPKITVVEHAKRKVPIERHEAGQRYRAVFGRDIDWQPIGFAKWLKATARTVRA